MERKSPRIRKLKMDRVQQVERPGNTSNNQRQNDRKNSLPKISPRGEQRQDQIGKVLATYKYEDRGWAGGDHDPRSSW